MLFDYDTSSGTYEYPTIHGDGDSGDERELLPWEEDDLERQKEHFQSLQVEIPEEAPDDSEPEERSPLDGLGNSILCDEIRWIHSNSWWGNSALEDWTFYPSREDLERGAACLRGVAEELQEEAESCVASGSCSSTYWRTLHRFQFLHRVVNAWHLSVLNWDGIDPRSIKLWRDVLDLLWRRTPGHRALEKMLRNRPGAKARKKAYDARVKKTPEALEKARLANRAARARKKGLVAA